MEHIQMGITKNYPLMHVGCLIANTNPVGSNCFVSVCITLYLSHILTPNFKKAYDTGKFN